MSALFMSKIILNIWEYIMWRIQRNAYAMRIVLMYLVEVGKLCMFGFLVILCVWIIGFLVICCCKGIKVAWREFNPMVIVKNAIKDIKSLRK